MKLCLKLRLKLIVVLSLSSHVLTRLGHMCVQSATSDSHIKAVSTFTNEFTVERSHLYVQCVTNDF